MSYEDSPNLLVSSANGIDRHARLTLHPDAAHGFLFQHHAEFAEDVEAFLAEPASSSWHKPLRPTPAGTFARGALP